MSPWLTLRGWGWILSTATSSYFWVTGAGVAGFFDCVFIRFFRPIHLR